MEQKQIINNLSTNQSTINNSIYSPLKAEAYETKVNTYLLHNNKLQESRKERGNLIINVEKKNKKIKTIQKLKKATPTKSRLHKDSVSVHKLSTGKQTKLKIQRDCIKLYQVKCTANDAPT